MFPTQTTFRTKYKEEIALLFLYQDLHSCTYLVSSAPCPLLSGIFLGLSFDLCKIVIVMNQMCLTTSRLLWGQKNLMTCSQRTWNVYKWRVLLRAVVALTFLLGPPAFWPCQNSLYYYFSLRCVFKSLRRDPLLWPMYSSAGATITKYRRLGGLSNRNLCPHSFGGRSSRSRCHQGWFPLTASLLGF